MGFYSFTTSEALKIRINLHCRYLPICYIHYTYYILYYYYFKDRKYIYIYIYNNNTVDCEGIAKYMVSNATRRDDTVIIVFSDGLQKLYQYT